MQIDPHVTKTLLESQYNNTSTANSVSDTSTDFSNILAAAAAQSSESTIQGDVTEEDGLLWLHIGPSKGASAYNPLLFQATGVEEGETKPTAYDALISDASRKYGVAESLIKAVIDTESSFNPYAVSSAGAKGLMQLMDATAQGLGVSNSFDPAENIDAGTRYLSYQLKRFNGQEQMALAAYNAGPTRVNRLGVSTDAELMSVLGQLPLETQKYISKIQDARSKYLLG
ncbi:lytic transglycosylase domain-containing protein [Paenibacillus sp. FSL K6-1230]|uniref:lytic transglycosylase domain-containing protein n=1 Tax=Paenibacillus sp. FSL K6-1230 TaxID=2921603 RepID=UPI0030F7E6C1